MDEIHFKIDGKSCTAQAGQTILEAARANGVYIPTLCSYDGLKPAGSCRLCTVKAGGRNVSACYTPVAQGMYIENMTDELEDMRKAVVEMLFVEGNHICPACEKSGSCELQAHAYRYRMSVPRFPYMWQQKEINAESAKIFHDGNRCIRCQRCIRGIATKDGFRIFGLIHRGSETIVQIDVKLASQMSDEQAERAMKLCPVGAIIRKEKGFVLPVGKRRFDTEPIGDTLGR